MPAMPAPPARSRSTSVPCGPISKLMSPALAFCAAADSTFGLATWIARQGIHEVDRPGQLVARDLTSQVLEQLCHERRTRRCPGRGLDDRLDFLAPLLVRDAEHGHVGNGRMPDQRVLHLRRVD